MKAMWVSLKENVNCRSKLSDVPGWQQKCRNQKTFSSENENFEVELQLAGNPLPKALFRPNFPRTQLYKVDIDDPTRNIIEIIFLKALMNPSKPSSKIKHVLKVKNSVETLERFEKYRENVKRKAYGTCKTHPRSSVDGNELLRFYGTVMTCGERPAQVSELCKDPFCRVCRLIQCNFHTEHLKKNGVQLSTSSKELCENVLALTKMKNVERAVMVCRTIAGNMVDGEYAAECDSFTNGVGDLIVKTPSALLPCFVIVFN